MSRPLLGDRAELARQLHAGTSSLQWIADAFSLVFAANGLGIMVFGQASGFLIGRVATERTLLRVSLAAATLGGLGVLLSAALGLPLPLLLACLFVVVSMLGVVLPSAPSLAMADHGSAAGAASSIVRNCRRRASSPRTRMANVFAKPSGGSTVSPPSA